MSFPIIHGIQLSKNSAINNATLEQVDTTSLNASDSSVSWKGRLLWNTNTDKPAVFDGTQWQDVADAATLTTLNNTMTNNALLADGTNPLTATWDVGNEMITGLPSPVNNSDATNKAYVDNSISNLGKVFSFRGRVSGGTSSTPTQVDLSAAKTGDYYQITADGVIQLHDGTTYVGNPVDGLTGDSFVVVDDGSGNFDLMKIDNTDVAVIGSSNFISVTGDGNSGYTVDVDTDFKNRVSTAETQQANIITNSGLHTDGSLPNGGTNIWGGLAQYITDSDTIMAAIGKLDNKMFDNYNHMYSNFLQKSTTALNAKQDVESPVNFKSAVDLSGDGYNKGGTFYDQGQFQFEQNRPLMVQGLTDSRPADYNKMTTTRDLAWVAVMVQEYQRAKEYAWTSSSAATQHVVTMPTQHNFSDAWANSMVTILVQNPSTNLWAHDIVDVTWNAGWTEATIDLSVSRNVKMIVRKVDDAVSLSGMANNMATGSQLEHLNNITSIGHADFAIS